jgi:hypothetical protein
MGRDSFNIVQPAACKLAINWAPMEVFGIHIAIGVDEKSNCAGLISAKSELAKDLSPAV